MTPSNVRGTASTPDINLYWRIKDTAWTASRPSELWVYDTRAEVGLNAATTADAYSRVSSALHMRFVRTTMYWNLVEPVSSTTASYDAGQLSAWDDAVNRANAAGIELIVILSVPPRNGGPADGYLPSGISSADRTLAFSRFARFAGDMVARYQGKVRFWELWNEWDIGAFTDLFGGAARTAHIPTHDDASYAHQCGVYYAQMLQQAYPAVQSRDAAAWVLVGGLGSASPACADVVQGLFDGGAADRFDFLNLHAYGQPVFPLSGTNPFVDYGTAVQTRLASLGEAGRPMWCTEFGQDAADLLFGYGYQTTCPTGDPVALVDGWQKEQWQRCLDYNRDNRLYTKITPYALYAPTDTLIAGGYVRCMPQTATASYDFGKGIITSQGVARPTYTWLGTNPYNSGILSTPVRTTEVSVITKGLFAPIDYYPYELTPMANGYYEMRFLSISVDSRFPTRILLSK